MAAKKKRRKWKYNS